jgi:hypothetical protein
MISREDDELLASLAQCAENGSISIPKAVQDGFDIGYAAGVVEGIRQSRQIVDEVMPG